VELNKEGIPPISDIKHLKLLNVRLSQDYMILIDGLLWSCPPKLLSIESNFQPKSKLIKVYIL
jgi:hypothetical protein